MNYSAIKTCDIANGPGVRVSLFVSGCRNHCPGCFNQCTWDFNYGQPFTNETLLTIMDQLSKPYITGLTILGGEPLEPENIDQVTTIISVCKRHFPDKTIWLYTGNNFQDYTENTCLMKNTDVIVDGRYEQDRRNVSLAFRGSSNQRIIDVGASIRAGHAVALDTLVN